MNSQTSFILQPQNQPSLEKMLKDGWRVVHTCPMPAERMSDTWAMHIPPTCLVILEKSLPTE